MSKDIVLKGSVRKLKGFMVFYPWPCFPKKGNYRIGLPHFLILNKDDESKLKRLMRDNEYLVVRIRGEENSAKIKGMDGTVVLKEILEVGESIYC